MTGVANQMIGMLMAIAALSVGASAMYASSARPSAGHLGSEDLRRLIDRAVQEGGRTGDGATLTFTSGSAGTLVQLFDHRPYGPTPGVSTSPVEELQLERNVAVTFDGLPPPYSIFLDPDGRVQATSWATTQGAIAPPGCTGPITLSVRAGAAVGTSTTSTLTVGCDASVQ